MNRFNARGVRVRCSKNQENTSHVPGIMEASSIRPLVLTNNPVFLSFNSLLLSTYYEPGVRDVAVPKADKGSRPHQFTTQTDSEDIK